MSRGTKGHLYVVSGPSGAGKSTICRMVRKMLGINLATSATTRAPREGEMNGRDYYFLTKEEFLAKEKNGEFLEYATVHGNYYGTLKSEVESRLLAGEDVILEIDVQGGLQVKAQYPDAHLIFFKTPTMEELEVRLRGRKTDGTATTIQQRTWRNQSRVCQGNGSNKSTVCITGWKTITPVQSGNVGLYQL